MPAIDFTLTPTTSFATASSFITSDTDLNDISNALQQVTITNQTNVVVTIKNSRKSAVSGAGRNIAVGASVTYPSLFLNNLWIKAAGTPTGTVCISGLQ